MKARAIHLLHTAQFTARLLRRLPRSFARQGLDRLQEGVDLTIKALPLQEKLLISEGQARGTAINRSLAWSLAFVAGAVNAGGFLAVARYTSHMTGAVSSAADELVVGSWTGFLGSLSMVATFFSGSFLCTFLIALGRRSRVRSRYAVSLTLEAMLLLMFGLIGGKLSHLQEFHVPLTTVLLCLIMGMHNAIVTNISGAVVRTTHLTGIVTDLGIEVSHLLDETLGGAKRTSANREKIRLHGLILLSFFCGGVTGAIGFKQVGYKATVPLAAFLLFLAARPLLDDLYLLWRLVRRRRAHARFEETAG
jgi:uncharacterized membrane protein YoaK (UPF0700 family)